MRAGRRFIFGVVVVVGMVLAPGHARAGTSESSTLTVTKSFEGGTAPDGTTFEIQVHCQSGEAAGAESGAITQTLTFGSTGGSQMIDVPPPLDVCFVTETDDGGAVTVAYASDTPPGGPCDARTTGLQSIAVAYDRAAACAVTVTNIFPLSLPPPPSPPPTAAPAPVTPAAPAFTG